MDIQNQVKKNPENEITVCQRKKNILIDIVRWPEASLKENYNVLRRLFIIAFIKWFRFAPERDKNLSAASK